MKKEKFKVLLYLKKSSPDKSGKSPIMGRITVGRTMAQFSLKLSCDASLWNARASRLTGKSREAVEGNANLDKLLLAIHAAYETLSERKQPFDAVAVKEFFQGGMSTRMTMLSLLDRFNEEFRQRIGIDRAANSIKKYTCAGKVLAEFIRKKFNVPDIAFDQLNEAFIREFQDFATQEKGLSCGTVRHYLFVVRKICRIAYKEGYSGKHYFAHYTLPKQKEVTPKTLLIDEFERIRDMVIPIDKRSHIITRDMFLFSCYTGAAYVDVVAFTGENLVKDDAGAFWLEYNRHKNGCPGRVKLLPEAIALIDRYRDPDRTTLFPTVTYSTVRMNMRGLGVLAGIKRELTYRLARHFVFSYELKTNKLQEYFS